MDIICRTCFKGFKKEHCLPFSSVSGFQSLDTIEGVVEDVIPEMARRSIQTTIVQLNALLILEYEFDQRFPHLSSLLDTCVQIL